MPLLIDGYNLMHATGIASAAKGRTPLERERLGLLDFLAVAIDWATEVTATIVFDSAAAPPGLPDQVTYRGLDVRFARAYRDADEMLEELVRSHDSPRRLTVVSSDHRVQRAAKRRRARAIDADVWYEQVRAAHHKQQTTDQQPDRPSPDSHADAGSAFSDEYLQQVADELKAAQLTTKSKRVSTSRRQHPD